MKPISGKNKSPFGTDGVAIYSAIDADGNTLPEMRILRQCSAHRFDLQSVDGKVIYTRMKLVAAGLDASDTDIEVTSKLNAGEFALPVKDEAGNRIGFARKITLHRVVLQDSTVAFDIDLASDLVAVTEIAFSNPDLTCVVGDTVPVGQTVLPANATDKSVTFVSSAPAKATVSSTGIVTGVAAGTAIITVTAKNGVKSTITVTVIAA